MPVTELQSRRRRADDVVRAIAGNGRHAFDLAVLAALSLALVWRFLVLHGKLASSLILTLRDFAGPSWFPSGAYGYWAWWDQRYYMEAALAWSHFVLDPQRHHYPPGYPILGALFARLTPADPFLVPNLACLVGSLWVFASLGARVLGDVRHARAVAGAVFGASIMFSPQALWIWVVPWTTTPATLAALACLLAAARFAERPTAADAFAAAFTGAALAAFRPVDAVIVSAGVCCVMGWTIVRLRIDYRRLARIGMALTCGALLPLCLFGGAYVAVNGWRASPYLMVTKALGFEWRLLPVRWVTLMIDPRPLFPVGQGLAEVFPWIVPGLAGMALALTGRGQAPWRLHALVVGTVLADCLMFLTYRDLHPPALFRTGIFHYFKLMLPVFALYAVLLVRAVIMGPRVRAGAALVAVVFGLFMWRVDLTHASALPPITDPSRMALPDGLSRMNDAVLAEGHGNLTALYQATNRITSTAGVFNSFYDYKIYAASGTIMILPLRPMPDAPGTLMLPPDVAMDVGTTPMLARQTFVWGLPCWWLPASRAACGTDSKSVLALFFRKEPLP